MAFILHSLSLLAENGTAAIVCFYRGGAEQKIRKYLIVYHYSIAGDSLRIILFGRFSALFMDILHKSSVTSFIGIKLKIRTNHSASLTQNKLV